MNDDKLVIGTLLLGATVLLCILIGMPFVVIWCLNILGFKIAYTFWTWLAVFLLLSIVGGSGVSFRKQTK